jgi:Fe2+ transport system protein FeoA
MHRRNGMMGRYCSHPCCIDSDRTCREVDPARHPKAVPLSSLGPGQKGTFVYSEREGGSAALLCEIGLVPGTEVELVRAAPMWGPVIVRVRGTDIALGHRIANHIFVDVVGG